MTGPSVKFSVIVLAGQRPGTDPVAEARGVKAKALAPVAGRAMILNVLDALEASPWVGDVYITLEDPKLSEAEPRLMAYAETGHIVQGTGTICGSVLSAVETRDIKTPFLVVTADHALLTADMLDHFCEDAARAFAAERRDFLFGVVSERSFRHAYPSATRTFLDFRDDSYSGCNLYAFMSAASFRVLDFWHSIEQQRKKPLRLIRAFGMGNLVRYLLRLDSLTDMINRAGRKLGVNGKPVIMPQPEAAIDVDTPRDLILVEQILGARRAETGQAAEALS